MCLSSSSASSLLTRFSRMASLRMAMGKLSRFLVSFMALVSRLRDLVWSSSLVTSEIDCRVRLLRSMLIMLSCYLRTRLSSFVDLKFYLLQVSALYRVLSAVEFFLVREFCSIQRIIIIRAYQIYRLTFWASCAVCAGAPPPCCHLVPGPTASFRALPQF
jgi:hypothetical protein